MISNDDVKGKHSEEDVWYHSCALTDSQLVPQIYIESETEQKYSLKYFVWNNETAGKWGQW